MPFPTYSVNGVPMADSLGRWHEHAEMSVFPSFPGLRATALSISGVGGEYPLSQAPLEPQDFVLHMVVNAVDSTGKRADTQADRLYWLERNAQILLGVLKTAEQTQGNLARIIRSYNNQAAIIAYARLEASSEVEYTPGNDYLEVKFIFRIPSGTWRARSLIEKVRVVANHRITRITHATAPIDDAWITLVGPFEKIMVTNSAGNGFRYSGTVPEGQAVSVRANHWTVTAPFTVNPADAEIAQGPGPYNPSAKLESVGHASGTALTILPNPEGAVVNVSAVGNGNSTSIHLSFTEAYF